MLRLIYTSFVVCGVLSQTSTAQSDIALRRNLAVCLSGGGPVCDEKLLTPEQVTQVRAAAARRNYRACANGLGAECKEELLTPEQAAEVREARSRHHYQGCLTGLLACDESALTPAQKADLREVMLRRNYRACLAGLGFGCDEKLLTREQAERVGEAALSRNYKACANGLRTNCIEKHLTVEQAAEVGRLSMQRNFQSCMSGLKVGCNEALLTAPQAERVQAAAQERADKIAQFREDLRRQSELIARWHDSYLYNVPAFDCDSMPEKEIAPIINDAAQSNRMEGKLIRRVIERESAYHACAVSPKGAKGLMQLMPATMAQFGVTDPFDAKQNIEAGARFLKQLMERYKGNLALALAAYNAGPATVDQASGIPNIKETQDYVESVLKRVR